MPSADVPPPPRIDLPRRLPLRCSPIPGESLTGFVMRLAELNRVAPATLVDGVLNEYPPVFIFGPEVDHLAALSGASQEVVRAICPEPRVGPRSGSIDRVSYMGHVLTYEDLARRRKVCPACLAASPHERSIWSIDALLGCFEHDRRFVRECSACGERLDWDRTIGRCACGQALEALVAPGWTAEEREVTAYVHGRLLGAAPLGPERLDRLDLHDALTLIAWASTLRREPSATPGGRREYASGFGLLAGARDLLLEAVRERAGGRYRGGGNVGTGRLQPRLPGVELTDREPIAELIREAAAG